jgi:hypothetical protein
VTSLKDQKQYWLHGSATYRYFTVEKFSKAFHQFHEGQAIAKFLEVPFEKNQSSLAALATSKYGVSKRELVKAVSTREVMLMRRNSSLYLINIAIVS